MLGWIDHNEFVHYISEIGVLLLMFIAGLETDLKQLKENWKSAVAVAVGGIILPFIGGFGFSYFADWLGMAGIIGAFAAGIAISQTGLKHTVEQKVEPIAYSIFVPVFFASIGLHVSFQGVPQQIGFIVVLTLAAVLTKLLGGAIGARITGFSNLSSFAVGAGMVSRGEVALIIASTGLQAGLLMPGYFTSVVMVVILTTLIAPPLLKILLQGHTMNSSKEIGL